MKRKIFAGAASICLAACMGITAFAASSTSFLVNNVTVVGSHEVTDNWDYNPFTGDVVKATTSAVSIMDWMSAEAKVGYATPDGVLYVVAYDDDIYLKKISATATAPSFTVGCQAYGQYGARHSGFEGSGETATYW